MFMQKNKKGMSNIIPFILGFFGVGLIGAVFVIVLAALKASTTDGNALSVINNTTLLFTNFSGQFGTIGTVAGVLLLVVLIGAAGIGGYMVYNKYR